MDHMPTPKINRDKALENAARLKDVSDRAKVARPIDQGVDIIRRPVDGMDLDYGTPMDQLRDIL